MTSKQVQSVKTWWNTSASSFDQHASLDDARDFNEGWSALTKEPGGVDYVETDAAGVRAMWILPKGCRWDRVLLYTHGGGYFAGSMYTHRKLVAHLAQAIGCRALNVDYRRTPEHRHPAQVEDAAAAYRHVLEQGVLPQHVLFAGDSAGGGLVIGTQLWARDHGLPLPGGALTISGWFDLELAGKSYDTNREKDVLFRREMCEGLVKMLIGEGGDRRDPYVSPLHGDLRGLPPVYMQCGGDEGLLDDSRMFEARAKEAGVDARLDVFPEMLHSFQMAAGFAPESNEAIARMAEWARARLGLAAKRTGR